MGFFSWRRKKESAIPASTDTAALGSFAQAEGQAVVGRQVGGGAPQFNMPGMDVTDTLALLGQIGPMIPQAIATGNAQISVGEPQVINARGTELGDQIKDIMRQHGIDPDSGQVNAQPGDTNTYLQMQQQILQALARHGIDTDASGTSINVTNVQVEGAEGLDELPGGQQS